MIRKYKAIMPPVTAVQWTGENKREVYSFLGSEKIEGQAIKSKSKYFYIQYGDVTDSLMLVNQHPNSNDSRVSVGNMIVKMGTGLYDHFSKDYFETIYEETLDD